jgi:3-hydroxyacyl-CoA dehydrogenase
MRSGIAQVAAQKGFHVRLVDRTDAVLSASKARIGESVARVAKKTNAASDWSGGVLKNIQLHTNLEQACAGADVVVEAVVENLQVKWELFSQLEKFSPPHAVLASNTSSLSIGQIASALGNPARLGGLHFFNPVPVMQLVEVVHAPKTSVETVAALAAFAQRLGKTVVHARDTPGFIVNRLLVPFMAEAMRMLERGDASLHDIDTAMKLGSAHPMGPLALADYVGLDTCKFIMDGWAEAHPEEALFRTPEVLNKLVGSGQLGLKSGAGFYAGTEANPKLAGFLAK